MAKKDFKSNNPALAFISGSDAGEQRETVEETSVDELEQSASSEASFTDIPDKAPQGYKFERIINTPNGDFVCVETKSKRLQLLLQPSVYNAAKKKAKAKKISMNEFITSVLKKELKDDLMR